MMSGRCLRQVTNERKNQIQNRAPAAIAFQRSRPIGEFVGEPEGQANTAFVDALVHPVGSKNWNCRKGGDLSSSGVASPDGASYDFLDNFAGPRRVGGRMDWARILAYVTGTVDQELLARNEYLAAENRILKAQLKGRLKVSDAERATLGEIAHR